ncbi:hypothetical protein HN51_069770, partial [Arachis hypogaea]
IHEIKTREGLALVDIVREVTMFVFKIKMPPNVRIQLNNGLVDIEDEKQQLLLDIRRANRQPANISSSVLSSDSMHIGILAAATHDAANNSPFTVFYNPRASPSEFVIPLVCYSFSQVLQGELELPFPALLLVILSPYEVMSLGKQIHPFGF